MSNDSSKNKPTPSLIEQIRDLYVTGTDNKLGERVYPSIESLAEDFNVGKVTLFSKAKD